MEGTWSITFTSDTEFTVKSASGQTTSGSLTPATAALFNHPLYAYFGTNPAETASIGALMELSNVSVLGVPTPINENFASPIIPNEGLIEKSGNGARIIQVIPGTNPFWIRWTVPDTNWGLQRSTGLSAWEDHNAGSYLTRGQRWVLAGPAETAGSNKAFFRLRRP
jgi:hypothetical protein